MSLLSPLVGGGVESLVPADEGDMFDGPMDGAATSRVALWQAEASRLRNMDWSTTRLIDTIFALESLAR
jgi:hypothetical protein